MTRALTYNILVGGKNRVDQLAKMIDGSQADIIGMVEATNPVVIEELAQRLDMQYTMSGRGTNERDWQMAVLSRLPIIETKLHTRPDIFLRKHLLEVSLQEANGSQLSVFVIHQPAGYGKAGYSSGEGNPQIRRAEIREILAIMAEKQGTPHLLMGDFNSIVPGDQLEGSAMIRHSIETREHYMQRHPEHRVRIGKLRLGQIYAAHIMARAVLSTKAGRWFTDQASKIYGRGGIDLLLRAGYTDSFRHANPEATGFTFPAARPACRIDYIFVSPELKQCLNSSTVINCAPGVRSDEASDHLPVCVDFAVKKRLWA